MPNPSAPDPSAQSMPNVRRRPGRWHRRATQSAYAFASNPTLHRIEQFAIWLVAGTAAIMGFGALKAVLKGAGVIPAGLSNQISKVIIPVGGALTALVLLGLFAVFVAVALKSATPAMAESDASADDQLT